MRRVLLALSAISLTAIVVVGYLQSQEGSGSAPPKLRNPSAAEVQKALAGSPPQLAALHRQANELIPGAQKAVDARVRALRGHPVVVNVWAAWCGPCREELPVFQQAALTHGRNVGFMGVDIKDSRDSARALLRSVPLTYPSYEDPDGNAYSHYKIVGTPSTVFYDASGRQTYVHQGPYYQQADLTRDIRRYALGERA
jgi:cytochrome c biogenesis protein CcmG, thiol:disulfide interchange protein DsbE